MVRFNDLTQTVLAVEDRTGHAAASLWRQCVDVLAQHDQPGKTLLEQEDRVALVGRLHDLRSELTEAQRIASVVELGSRLRSPALIEFFASDRPSVCAAAIARARLPDLLWPVLLSRLGPTARGVLRGRRDIGPETRLALEAFGSTDLVLGSLAGTASNDLGIAAVTDISGASAAPEDEAAVTAETSVLELETIALVDKGASQSDQSEERSQIRQLVEKIERFTSGHRLRPHDDASDGEARGENMLAQAKQLDHFPFETDAEGAFIWVGEASRTALIGLGIGQPALPGETGPDGHVAGAFARRSSFQHGRLFIGEGLYAGEWRLSAVPFFDPASGRFQGYRGQARRPLVHEVPQRVGGGTTAPKSQPSLDSMRQIIHELRTPLNAILGFAEIIEQQLFGPAGVHYREMAGNILSDARRLLAAFDDIDLAARSVSPEEAKPVRSAESAVDLGPLIERVSALYEASPADERAMPVRIAISADLPFVNADPVQCERMIQHLARTLVSLAQEGEAVQGALWFQPDGFGGRVILGFDRPKRLRGLEEHEMLDPGYGNDGDWPDAPLLGLGFSMRLVRSLVQAQGGSLRIEQERILLELPVADAVVDDVTG